MFLSNLKYFLSLALLNSQSQRGKKGGFSKPLRGTGRKVDDANEIQRNPTDKSIKKVEFSLPTELVSRPQ
jgi:hypothetical protein